MAALRALVLAGVRVYGIVGAKPMPAVALAVLVGVLVRVPPIVQTGLPGFWQLPAMRWLLAFGLYAGVAALWAADPLHGLQKAGIWLAVVILIGIGIQRITVMQPDEAGRWARAAWFGVLVAGVYLGVELTTGFPMTRLIAAIFPTVYTSYPNWLQRQGETIWVLPFLFNKSVSVLAIVTFPAVLLGLSGWRGERGLAATALLAAATGLAIMASEKEAAKLAWLTGMVVLALAWQAPRLAAGAVTAGWFAASCLVVPAGLALGALEIDRAAWLQKTGRARVAIWADVARATTERPFFGIGTHSMRAGEDIRIERTYELDADNQPEPGQSNAYVPRHPHNVFLQTWYELGVAGIVPLFVAGLALVWHLAGLSRNAAASGLAAFAGAVTLASFSHSLWYAWYLASFGLAGLFVAIGRQARAPMR